MVVLVILSTAAAGTAAGGCVGVICAPLLQTMQAPAAVKHVDDDIIQAVPFLEEWTPCQGGYTETLASRCACMCSMCAGKIYFNLLQVMHGLLHGWHCIAWA